jgi:hypothetical protein
MSCFTCVLQFFYGELTLPIRIGEIVDHMNRTARILLLFVLVADFFPAAAADPVEESPYADITERSEYETTAWFRNIARRSSLNQLGPTESHIEKPPLLDERREAIIDALWRGDVAEVLELAKSTSTGECPMDLRLVRKAADAMEPYRKDGLRTARQEPLSSTSKPGVVWCRHQWMSLPAVSDERIAVRGNLHLFFDWNDSALTAIWFIVFVEPEGQSSLPVPDDSLSNDPVRDRESVEVENDPCIPPGYGDIEENSEFPDRRRVIGVLGRNAADSLGKTEEYRCNPDGLDARREAIIDALWQNDESAFSRLAASPETGQGGLRNQTFAELFREIKRYRDEGIRTMRAHPINPSRLNPDSVHYWCRHQWMTIPDSSTRTPVRGNLNLIFDGNDLSLSFLRINAFPNNSSINVLPYPDSRIANDPVRDRAAAETK